MESKRGSGWATTAKGRLEENDIFGRDGKGTLDEADLPQRLCGGASAAIPPCVATTSTMEKKRASLFARAVAESLAETITCMGMRGETGTFPKIVRMR